MCCVEYAPFDETFVPTRKHVSFLKGIIYGSHRESHADNYEFAVYSGWIDAELPSPASNLDALIEAGFVLCVTEQFDGAVTYALTDGAEWWCEQNGIIPARDLRDGDTAWVDAIIFDRKRRRTPGLTRNGSSPKVIRTTSEFVRQVSYTPEEAVKERDEIDAMYMRGHITERSAAAYKAHVTRRIVALAAPVARGLTPAEQYVWQSAGHPTVLH